MRTEHIGKSTVKITVSREELAQAGLTVSDIDGENPLSLMLISGLIEKIYPESRASQLSIEVFPSKDSGCILYLSPVSPGKALPPVRTIITSDSVDGMMKVCRVIARSGVPSKNSVIIGEYGLLRLIADLPADSPSVTAAILKNASLANADSSSVACVLERGEVIIPKNAVESMLKLGY